MIYAISYSSKNYNNPKKWNLVSALQYGVDFVFSYSPEDIDKEFAWNNSDILKANRGAGYWLWKPYIILKSLKLIKDDDYLFYADAGTVYANDIHSLIDKMSKTGEDIVVFDQPYIEKFWSKRDAFILMDCDRSEYFDTTQRMATFLVLKKTSRSIEFVEEWLRLCTDKRIISDAENVMGLENYDGFIDHRHDQTVLSLLSKKWDIVPCQDPSINIQGWIGEEINVSEGKYWLSHKMPFVSCMDDLLMADKLFYKKYWHETKKTLVFGAGVMAKEFAEKANMLGKIIHAFLVSSKERITESEINGIPVYSIEEIPFNTSECLVVVAIDKDRDEVTDILDKKNLMTVGFQSYSRDNLIPYLKEACNIV